MPGARVYAAEVTAEGVMVEVRVTFDSRAEPFGSNTGELGEVVGTSAARLADQAVRAAQQDAPF